MGGYRRQSGSCRRRGYAFAPRHRPVSSATAGREPRGQCTYPIPPSSQQICFRRRPGPTDLNSGPARYFTDDASDIYAALRDMEVIGVRVGLIVAPGFQVVSFVALSVFETTNFM